MDAPTLVAYGDDAGKTGLICTQQVHTPPPLRAHGEAGLQTTLLYLARVAAMAVTRCTTVLRTHHYGDASANTSGISVCESILDAPQSSRAPSQR